jgi:site-specific DNA-cytosine methylase
MFCSYPENWKYVGSYSAIWARAGNSVMPLFAKALAETIKSQILDVHDRIINLQQAA